MSGIKKSKEIGEHSYKTGDVVLAKIRGYPRWPGMVVDPFEVPLVVAKERPHSKKTNFYCVRFFPAGDYSWTVSKDISLLQKHEIEAYINEPHKKSGDLLQGYKIALNPQEWEVTLEERQMALDEAEDNAEVDQLDEVDEDNEDAPKKAKPSKKRKRESEPKPKKREPKKSGSAVTESKEKKAGIKKKTGRKNGVRSKETIESEDDGADAEGEDAPAESSRKSGPASKRAKKEKSGDDGDFRHLANNPDAIKVKEWRHKLQRAFLSKTVPKPEEMSEYDQLFTTIENHDLTIEQLSYSKLGKVMRHISQLDPSVLPLAKDDKYNIRKRADVLLERWQGLISGSADATANVAGVNGAESKGEHEKPTEKRAVGKAVDIDKAKELPVNGMKTGVAAADPPAVEGEVAMDTADD